MQLASSSPRWSRRWRLAWAGLLLALFVAGSAWLWLAAVAFKGMLDSRLQGPSDPETMILSCRERLRSPDPHTRGAGALGLGNLGPRAREAVPDLVEALRDNDADVRFTAVVALLRIMPDPEEVKPALTAALEDRSPRVRDWARLALVALETGGYEGFELSAVANTVASGSPPGGLGGFTAAYTFRGWYANVEGIARCPEERAEERDDWPERR